jgi:hypothetical protein
LKCKPPLKGLRNSKVTVIYTNEIKFAIRIVVMRSKMSLMNSLMIVFEEKRILSRSLLEYSLRSIFSMKAVTDFIYNLFIVGYMIFAG